MRPSINYMRMQFYEILYLKLLLEKLLSVFGVLAEIQKVRFTFNSGLVCWWL